MSASPLPASEDRPLPDRLAHLRDGGVEFEPWLLPRIVTRIEHGAREFYGICDQGHGWLSASVPYPQDVPVCPRCEAQDASRSGERRFAAAQAAGLLRMVRVRID